jgi:hypothetical protein
MTNERIRVEPTEVMRLARSFTDQRQAPTIAGGAVPGARSVRTGDSGVDADVQAVADSLVVSLGRMNQVLAGTGDWLRSSAESYRSDDALVAESYDELRRRPDPTAPTS